MKIFGIDFTSAPSKKKPITCACGQFVDGELILDRVRYLTSFVAFEQFLAESGPWVSGLDFPFGLPRKLIENLDWPRKWESYVGMLSQMEMDDFVNLLAEYRQPRPSGDKQHLRRTDKLSKSKSPMMLYGVPVGRMFFRGAPYLLNSEVNILPSRPRPDDRVVIEAYPALVARRWVDKQGYKNDQKSKQTPIQKEAREAIVSGVINDLDMHYGFSVQLLDKLADEFIQDGKGDKLDAMLCAIQAAWAYTQREKNYGIPDDVDPLEGWIVDPPVDKALVIPDIKISTTPIFVLTGVPGSGKSTTARELMLQFPFGVHIPLDDLRAWVVSGIAQPIPEWTEETTRQFGLAYQSAADLAVRYANAGFAVVIEQVIYPKIANEFLFPGLDKYNVHKIYLLPEVDIARNRNLERTNKDFHPAVLDGLIQDIHHSLKEEILQAGDWIVIDNSEINIEETVNRIIMETKK